MELHFLSLNQSTTQSSKFTLPVQHIHPLLSSKLCHNKHFFLNLDFILILELLSVHQTISPESSIELKREFTVLFRPQ